MAFGCSQTCYQSAELLLLSLMMLLQNISCRVSFDPRYGPPPGPYDSFFNQTATVVQVFHSNRRELRGVPMESSTGNFFLFNARERLESPISITSEKYGVVNFTWGTTKGLIPSAREDILEQLLPTYRRHERPNEMSSIPTTVNVFIHILAISSISVVNMEYTVDMYLRQTWTDPRLAWNNIPSLMHHTPSILITSKKDHLWLPDLFFRNGKRGFTHDMSVPNHLIRVTPNGSVLYSQKITMTFSCSMYLRNFPIDKQECGMNLGSYGYTLDELRFVWLSNHPVTIKDDLRLQEFASPKDIATMDCTTNGTTSTGTYSCLLLTIPFKRLVNSYVVTTYIPEILIVMVSWLGFWIDVKVVPARVTLGLFTLLGLLTEGSSVSSNLPRVTYIKAIDVWLTVCLLFVIGALVEFALAYLYAPREMVCEYESETQVVIEHILAEALGDCRCCCCYTKSTSHNPVSQRTSNLQRKTSRQRRSKYIKSADQTSCRSRMGVCLNISNSAQANCCQCTLCRQTKCVKALDKAKTRHSANVSSKRNDLLKRPIFIRDAQINSPVKTRRPISDSVSNQYDIGTMKLSMRKRQLERIPTSDRPTKKICNVRNTFSIVASWSLFGKNDNSRTNYDIPTFNQPNLRPEIQMYDSEVDAYSRFLFPACFLLFNCGYWFFYLIIVDE